MKPIKPYLYELIEWQGRYDEPFRVAIEYEIATKVEIKDVLIKSMPLILFNGTLLYNTDLKEILSMLCQEKVERR